MPWAAYPYGVPVPQAKRPKRERPVVQQLKEERQATLVEEVMFAAMGPTEVTKTPVPEEEAAPPPRELHQRIEIILAVPDSAPPQRRRLL